MLLIEKMEGALESIRESDFGSTISESGAALAVAERKNAFIGRVSEFKSKFVESLPFATEQELARFEERYNRLNRKLSILKKQLKDLDV